MLISVNVQHEFVEVDPLLLLDGYALEEQIHQERLPRAWVIDIYIYIYTRPTK